MPNFPTEDATAMAHAVACRARSAGELVDEALARVAAFDPLVRALTTQMAESAREAARQADRQVATGSPLPPLHGVPIVAKDLFDFQAGVPNTFGCVTLADFVPEETAAYLERLAAAGAIVIGRSNVPTFGHKGTTDNRLVGPTSTPFDLSRNAGGSSGGSAAAVATGMAPLAQGSDAGGSVRIPASCCGIVGLKPTFGRIPNTNRSDVFSSHTPFVQAGPLARTVRDAALALQVMAGPHPRDPLTCCDDARDFMRECEQSIAGKRIAFTPDWGVFAIEPSVAETTQAAMEALAEAGAAVEQPALRLPLSQDELAALWRRELAPFYAGLLGYFSAIGRDLERDPNADLPDAVRELAELGRSLTALDLQADQRLRTLVYHSLQDALDAYDFMAMPTLSCLPPANDADGQTLGPPTVAGRVVERTIGWCLTHPVNFTGHPAASVPAGLSREGLPVGLQVIGRRYEDGAVLSVCRALEQRRPWLPDLEAACARLLAAHA